MKTKNKGITTILLFVVGMIIATLTTVAQGNEKTLEQKNKGDRTKMAQQFLVE